MIGNSEPVVEIPDLLEYSHYTFSNYPKFFADTLGLDNTIKRRRGAKIKVKGVYRDPVPSTHHDTPLPLMRRRVSR